MSAAKIGDLITARPMVNRNGERREWRGIVTHVGDFAGKLTVSGVGVQDGDVSHLSSYVDEGDVAVVDVATGSLARAAVAGLYAREGMGERTRTRLLEIAQIVAFHRVAAMFPTGHDRHGETVDLIYGITHHDSGPASTVLQLKAGK